MAILSSAGLGERATFARSLCIWYRSLVTGHEHLKLLMLFAILTFLVIRDQYRKLIRNAILCSKYHNRFLTSVVASSSL